MRRWTLIFNAKKIFKKRFWMDHKWREEFEFEFAEWNMYQRMRSLCYFRKISLKKEDCICMTTVKRKKAIKIDDERHQSCLVLYYVELDLIECGWNELLKMLKAWRQQIKKKEIETKHERAEALLGRQMNVIIMLCICAREATIHLSIR